MKSKQVGDRREWIAQFWETRRHNVGTGKGYQEVLSRRLDRAQVLADNACFEVARHLLVNAILVFMCDEDDQARVILDAVEFYLETASQRDDLGIFGDIGQQDLGRSRRLRDLVLARWLRHGRMDLPAFRAASEMKEQWSHGIFSTAGWEAKGFNLGEWMAELILAGDHARARELADRYYYGGMLNRHHGLPSVEDVLSWVAESLMAPEHQPVRRRAEKALDGLYHSFTDWGPDFVENAVPYDQKLIYAYIRGKYFKDIEDPIQLIKMMKFSE